MLILQVLAFSDSGTAYSSKPHRVLFLASYDHQFPVVIDQLKGILELSHYDYRGRGLVIDVQMMDTKRHSPEEREQTVIKEIRERIELDGSYDLAITSDDNALHFMSRNKRKLFGDGLPVVFFGINDIAFGKEMADKPDYAGILEHEAIDETVSSAIALFPNVEKLVAIFDGTPTGLADRRIFDSTVSAEILARTTILNLTEKTYAEGADTLAAMGPNDVAILFSASSDGTGRRLGFWQQLNWLKNCTDRPIFHVHEHGIGKGLAGGKVTSHLEMATLAANYAKRILNGEPADSLPLGERTGNHYLFDWNVLKSAGAKLSAIPQESIILNKPSTFWSRHWKVLTVSAAVIVVLSAFGALVSILYIRKRQALKELSESESQISSLFASSYAPMLVADPSNCTIVDANPAALRYYGYTKDEITALEWPDISARDKNEFLESFNRIQAGQDFVVKTQHRTKNGDNREVEAILSSVQRNGTPHVFAIVQDITERQTWERELLESKIRLEEANKAKEQFLAIITHELRTPLNPIMGFSSLLLEDAHDDETRDYLGAILGGAKRMLGLIDNILELISIRQKGFKVKSERFTIESFMSAAITDYKICSNGNEIAFECGNPIASKDLVEGDPDILRQILDNLVGNACKFTSEGTVRIQSELIDDDEDADIATLKFAVEDNGIGIPKDIQGKIFNPFTQADAGYSRVYEGAGLGLAIVSELTQAIGGVISLTSEPGKGSRFEVTLPIKKVVAKAVL